MSARPWATLFLNAFLFLGLADLTFARQSAHVHGFAALDIAIESSKLSLHLDAPLESLLGFEHSPRTEAQKKAAHSLMQQLNQNAALVQPDKSAACVPESIDVTAPTLSTAHATDKPTATQQHKHKHKHKQEHEDQHADLSFSIAFTCAQPDKLRFVELGFFKTFPRLQRIDAQVATPKGQFKQTLERPEGMLKLTR